MTQSPQLPDFMKSNLVYIAVAVAGLLVVLLGTVLGHRAWSTSQMAASAQQAHIAMEAILVATDAQSRERALTAAWLSAGDIDAALPPELDIIRTEVDAAWDDARTQIIAVLGANNTVRRQLAKLGDALRSARAVRSGVDAGLSGEGNMPSLNDWLNLTSVINAQAAVLRQELLMAMEAPREVTRLHLLVNTHAAELAEHVGQLQGILAHYVATRAPMPPLQIERADFVKQLARERLTRLFAVTNELASESSEIAKLLKELRANHDPLRDTSVKMLAAAHTGTYPLSADEWLTRTSAFTDRVFSLTDAVKREAQQRSWQMARAQGLWLGGYGVLALVAGGLAIASLERVRRYVSDALMEKEVSETILGSIGDAVIATEADGRIKYLNPIASELTGWPQHEVRGRPYEEVFPIHNRLHSSESDPIGTCLRQDRIVVVNESHVLVTRDGREISIDDSCAPIRGPDGGVMGAVVVFTSKERHTRTMDGIFSYHASHDVLTGLYNRRAFEHHLHETLKDSRRQGDEHVLAFIDLDNFKVINDTATHEAGDQLLRRIGSMLKLHIRESDVLGRFGGDEFALLLKNCSLRQAEKIAHKLREEIRDLRFSWKGQSFQSGLSIGLVSFNADVLNVEKALHDTDAACQAAKELGRNHVYVHRSDDQRLAERQGYTTWAAHITEALDEERFMLYCQEILPLRAGLAMHSEVLLRLRQRDGTLVRPGFFIPAAERHRLMPDIDQWVIDASCKMTTLKLAANSQHALAINLSGTTLSDIESADRIIETVQRHKVAPTQLCFEITETAAVSSLDTALAIMERLRDEGFRFALDDFGAGLSSLNYLKELPVDMVKIDGRFIRRLPDDPVATAMVGAIVNIAEVMRITTCAEFVESATILAALENLGVDYGQGYYFAEPHPLTECLEKRPDERPDQLTIDYS